MRNRDTQVFIRHLFYLFFLKGFSLALPILMVPLLISKIGIQQLGIISFIEVIVNYAYILICYGFRYSATQQIAKHKEDKQMIGQIIGSVYTIQLVAIFLSLLLGWMLILLIPKIQQLQAYFYTYFFAVVMGSLFPHFVFQGLEKMQWMAVINVLTKILFFIGVIKFIQTPSEALLYHFLMGVSYLLRLLIALYAIYYVWGLRIIKPTWHMIKLQLYKGVAIFLTQLSTTFNDLLPTILLGLFSSHNSVATYTLGTKVIKFIKDLTSPLTQALFPTAHKKLEQNFSQGIQFIRKIYLNSVIVLITIGAGYWIFSRNIVQLLAGEIIQDAVWVLRSQAFLPCLIICSKILGIGLLIPTGAGKQYTLITWVTGLLGAGLQLILIPKLQAEGAALAILMSETTTMIMIGWQVYRRIKILQMNP